jgi:hypothetical protein
LGAIDRAPRWANDFPVHSPTLHGGDRCAARRVNDARSRRSPYFWALLTNPFEDRQRLYEGLISTARVILLGLCMDAIYQWIVLKTFYPVEAVIVAIGLAFFPYLLLRGPIARIARWRLDATAGERR